MHDHTRLASTRTESQLAATDAKRFQRIVPPLCVFVSKFLRWEHFIIRTRLLCIHYWGIDRSVNYQAALWTSIR